MRRLVIVDPAYASTVGHHGEVNRPLLAGLAQADWRPELWADVALEAEATAPKPLRGVFSGCGYEDPRHWRELGGMVQLARRLEQQLAQATSGSPAVQGWLAHSLLPFQLLGLARHLSQAPPAQVLISLMFAPGETLKRSGDGEPDAERATANTRVALAAMGRACRQQGHQLTLGCSSSQHQTLYAPLLAATGLERAGLHPAVVGAGHTPQSPPPEDTPLVLLHWGDLKAGKGQQEALALLQSLLEQGLPPELAGWGWLWHQHSATALSEPTAALLQRAEQAGLELVRLEGEVGSQEMGEWLARCSVALLAYDPQHYGQRSSGMLWQWAGGRAALGLGATGIGYGEGWLAEEARALGVGWRTVSGGHWLREVAAAAAAAQPLQLSSEGETVLLGSFWRWCQEQLS